MKKVYLILVQSKNGESTFLTKVFEKNEDAAMYAKHLNERTKKIDDRIFTAVRVNMYTERAYVEELLLY